MMNSYKEDYTLNGYIEHIMQINDTGLTLEAIIISSIIFIRLFKIRLQDVFHLMLQKGGV